MVLHGRRMIKLSRINVTVLGLQQDTVTPTTLTRVDNHTRDTLADIVWKLDRLKLIFVIRLKSLEHLLTNIEWQISTCDGCRLSHQWSRLIQRIHYTARVKHGITVSSQLYGHFMRDLSNILPITPSLILHYNGRISNDSNWLQYRGPRVWREGVCWEGEW